jgi:hypothetical protein
MILKLLRSFSVQNKILDLSHFLYKEREPFWTKNVNEFQGVSYTQFPDDVGEFEANWQQISKEYNVIILTEVYHDFIFKKINSIPTFILNGGMADAIIKNTVGDWVPYCFIREALFKSISRIAPQLDTNGTACITGSGEAMHSSFSVLNQMGFSKFIIINDKELDSDALLKNLQKHFFNIDVKFMKSRDLALEENSGIVLINTVSGEQYSELLESLSYLNFINKGGLVIDFDYQSINTHLTIESQRVGLHTLRGSELQGFSDFLLLSKIFKKLSLSPSQYLTQWSEFIKIQSKV